MMGKLDCCNIHQIAEPYDTQQVQKLKFDLRVQSDLVLRKSVKLFVSFGFFLCLAFGGF